MRTRQGYILRCEVTTCEYSVVYDVDVKVRSTTKINRIVNVLKGVANLDTTKYDWQFQVYKMCKIRGKVAYRVHKRMMVDTISDDMSLRTLSCVGYDRTFKLVLTPIKK